MKKPNPPIPINSKAKDSPLKLNHFRIDPEHHAEFKAAMLAAAREAVDTFPKQLEAVGVYEVGQSPYGSQGLSGHFFFPSNDVTPVLSGRGSHHGERKEDK